MIHIEGMGWFGAALALRLDHERIPFTWHDTDTRWTSWQASTGIAYPAGDDRSNRNLTLWHTLPTTYPGFAPYTTNTSYVYKHKKPPHQGKYPVIDHGWARIASVPAVTVDVPALVPAVREQFAARRVHAAPDNVPTIAAHGYTKRLDHYVWGWSAPVKLDTTALDTLPDRGPGNRYAFYGRVHRFQMAYAYPIVTRPGWYRAGSALVVQRTAQHGKPGTHLDRWAEGFTTLFPAIPILNAEPAIEGWRPAADSEDTGLITDGGNRRIEFPPLWHSGVRWAPELIDAAIRWCHLTLGTKATA